MITQKQKTWLRDIMQNMILFIKKWWLLENLRKEINRHSGFQTLEEVSSGRKVLISRHFFIAGNKEKSQYPGLAEKSFWWWKKKYKYSEDELKKRIQEYNDIFEVCIKEGFIEIIEGEKSGQKIELPSVATPKAYEISGWFGLFEGILEKYKSVWTMIFLPIVTFVLGLIFRSIINL
jgi:hypothetical protein